MNRDQRIYEIATDLIRSASMKHDLWKATSIGASRISPRIPFDLAESELPLVSASFPEGEGYVWTTRRVLSCCYGQLYECLCEEVTDGDFGRFKGPPGLMNIHSGPAHTLTATLHIRSGSNVLLRYETGYASMGPIQCLKYWQLKHPILHKLMTPFELEEYQRRRPGKKVNDVE